MRRAVLFSLALHALVAALLAAASVGFPSPPPPSPSNQATIEMILNAPGGGDAPAERGEAQDLTLSAPPPAPLPPVPATPEAEPPAPVPPTPPSPTQQAEPAEIPSPPPPPPAASAPKPPSPKRLPPQATPQPSSPAPPAPPSDRMAEPPPAVRLGEGGQAGLTNEISGDIPASPDPTAPNLPPRYPPEAARRGQQGAVILSVTIAPDGTAGAVAIAQSSGYVLLDRAAQQAVARWHFKPELDRVGLPVPSRMPIRIRFVLD